MRRHGTTALLITVALAAVAPRAHAGIYNVVACADTPGAVNNSWIVSNNAPTKLEAGSGCGSSGSYAGLYARDVLAVSNASAGASAQWTFAAPSGTTITALSYSRWLYKEDDDGWQPALRADGAIVDGCTIPATAISCTAGLQGGQRTNIGFAGVGSLSAGVLCASTAPITCGNGGTLHAAVAVLYGATVTLSDSSAPTISNLGGPLLAGGYRTGSQFASFDASDNAGIRTGRLYVDGSLAAGSTYSCDFTFTVPCANRSAAELVLDTRSLADGTHSVQLAGVDPAGNETKSTAQSITVDNAAPASPASLAVDGGDGDGWHPSNSFAVTWTNPAGQVAPIAVAHYKLCASDGSTCQSERQVAGQGASHIDGIAVPSTGEWQLRVWLEDAAGNVDSTHRAVATLRYGSAPLPTPRAESPTTSVDASPPATSDPIAPFVAAAPTWPSQPSTTRRDIRLRLTSARVSQGRLVIRGRVLSGVTVRVRLTVRPARGAPLRKSLIARRGRFTIALRKPLRGRVTAQFPGSASLQPAAATITTRG